MKSPVNESSAERKFQGTKVPGNFRFVLGNFRFVPGNEWSEKRSSLQLLFPGTKVPGNEKSQERKRKLPIGTICSWKRKVLGTKSSGTVAMNTGRQYLLI